MPRINIEQRQGSSTSYETLHVNNLEELKDQLRQRNASRIALAVVDDAGGSPDFHRDWMSLDDLNEDDFIWLQHTYDTIALWRTIKYY